MKPRPSRARTRLVLLGRHLGGETLYYDSRHNLPGRSVSARQSSSIHPHAQDGHALDPISLLA